MRLLRPWHDARLTIARTRIDDLQQLLNAEIARRLAAEQRYINRVKICHCLPESGDRTA